MYFAQSRVYHLRCYNRKKEEAIKACHVCGMDCSDEPRERGRLGYAHLRCRQTETYKASRVTLLDDRQASRVTLLDDKEAGELSKTW